MQTVLFFINGWLNTNIFIYFSYQLETNQLIIILFTFTVLYYTLQYTIYTIHSLKYKENTIAVIRKRNNIHKIQNKIQIFIKYKIQIQYTTVSNHAQLKFLFAGLVYLKTRSKIKIINISLCGIVYNNVMELELFESSRNTFDCVS